MTIKKIIDTSLLWKNMSPYGKGGLSKRFLKNVMREYYQTEQDLVCSVEF